MNTLALLSSLAVVTTNGGGLLGILLEFAIACIVIWAIYALLQWAGITIPRPVQIVLIALICIIAIIWLFRVAGQFM